MSSTATRERAETSASDSSGHSTSTYRYSYEPWESFQRKLYTLVSQIFPHAKSTDIEIQRMRGGSSNRVVGISIRIPSPQGLITAIKNGLHKVFLAMGFPLCPLRAKVSHYILRIPRWGNEHTQRHIATLEFVSTRF